MNREYLENSRTKAVEENDTKWLYFLYEVSEQLHISKQAFKDVDLYNQMKNAYEED